jgi:8-oxo-dGTP diphosphatase
MQELPQRRSSRLVLLDSERRILLLQHAGNDGNAFWALPGGGLESGETFEQAAQREAVEELGLAGFPMKFLWEQKIDFVYIDRPVHQHECIFFIESGLPDISLEVQKTHQQEGILAMRWWTVTELESTSEVVFPEGLALQLRKISI